MGGLSIGSRTLVVVYQPPISTLCGLSAMSITKQVVYQHTTITQLSVV